MEIDFLTGSAQTLPVFVISVELTATILAYEAGAWDGVDYSDAEVEPFLDLRDPKSRDYDAPTCAHSWEGLNLKGAPLAARKAITALLLRDIEAGRLPTLQVRRDMKGALIPDATLLDIDAAYQWMELYGLDGGDSMQEYAQNETDIAVKALESIQSEREQLIDPEAVERHRQRAGEMNADAVIDILRENHRLRANITPQREKPLEPRTRTSLLCIIGALAKEAGLDLSQPMKAGETIKAMLPVDVKLSARTIGEHLKKVRVAMESRAD